MTSSFAVLRALSPRLRWIGAAIVVSLVLERALVVAGAVEFAAGRQERALAVGGVLAGVVALRGAVRAVFAARVQEELHAAAVRALLGGDVLRASEPHAIDAHTAVLEGTFHGVHLAADIFPMLVGDGLVSIAVAVLAVATQPTWLVVIAGLALVLATLALFAARAFSARISERAFVAYEPVSDDLSTVLGGRLEIVASGRRGAFERDAMDRLARWRALSLRSEAFGAIAGRAPLVAAAIGIVLGVGADRLARVLLGGIELGSLAVAASALPALLGWLHAAHATVRFRARVRPLVDLLASPPAPRGAGASAPISLPAPIEWRDVTFSYSGREGEGHPVLRGESIRWEPGQILVLAGPNGSGKSTTLRILLGLAKPQSGSVLVGGAELFSLDLDAWRRQIAYLPQRPFLPERATLREAIHLLAPAASDDAMRAALERVGIWRALAEPDASPLDARVGTLSVGQRQRVALARVLCVDAPVLLLDEPDANLDAAGIRAVRGIVRDLAPHKMIAVVAHTEALVDLAGTLVTLRHAA